jgi:hypothetical protein
MKTIIFALLASLIIGCASVSVSSMSEDKRFSKYIGQDFPLKSDGILCKDGYQGDAHGSKPQGNELVLHHSDKCGYGGFIAKIPAGTLIHISDIILNKPFPPMWEHIYFIGQLKTASNKGEQFYYFYGFNSKDVPGKLPW